MTHLKNIAVGFGVSFIGSIPLGYLNVIGFDIYTQNGLWATVYYLLGVVLIEMFVIYFTLIFAKTLAENLKLKKFIQAFSIVFMFLLAYGFYSSAHSETNFSTTFNYAPLPLGIVLSSLNFIQIPFWTGWNVWLLNGQYIEVSGGRKYVYVLGTIAGTFCGMLTLILALHYFTSNIDFLSKYLMQLIIPLVFLCLGIYQALQFFRKYFA